MGGFRGALYLPVAAGGGCQFFAEPCWLQSSFPKSFPHTLLAGQGVDAADTAAAGIDNASGASGADIGVEFACTAAAGSDTLSPAVGGFGSTDTDTDPDYSISMLEPAVGGWKHSLSLLRSTKACHHMA